MLCVTGIGKVDYNREIKNGDTNLVLYLDEPSIGEGEIKESEIWDWDTGRAFIETSDVRTDTEMNSNDFERDRPLLLPRNIRWGLRTISCLIQCNKLAYCWSGGRRVDIRIVGMRHVRHKTAFLRTVANMLSVTAKDMPKDERLMEMLDECRSYGWPTDEERVEVLGEELFNKLVADSQANDRERMREKRSLPAQLNNSE